MKKHLHFCFICDNILERSKNRTFALVAQLDRVFGYEPKGQGFESLPARQNNRYAIRCVGCFFVRLWDSKDERHRATVRWTVVTASDQAAAAAARIESLPARQAAILCISRDCGFFYILLKATPKHRFSNKFLTRYAQTQATHWF